MKANPSTSAIQVRAASLEEAGSIAALLSAAFQEFEPLYLPEAYSATTPGADQIRARWGEGPVWVAVFNGVVAGTVAGVVRQDSLYVRSMAVLPAARGQNIAGLLLMEVEAYALEHGCGRLYLSTTPFLAAAIQLYQRCGFRRTDSGPTDLFGTPLFTMEKILPPSPGLK